MSIASLKQLASVFSNCPEDNKNECVDKEKHMQVSDFNMLKEILKEGEYNMTGIDYKQKKSIGKLNITQTNSSIMLDNAIVFVDEAITRVGTIGVDLTNRVYYNSTTQGENYTAKKQLNVISISHTEVIFSGNGSSLSTENYHCGENIKKILTQIDDNSFSIETTFGGKKGYVNEYRKQVDVGDFVAQSFT